ncbi:unnamed protein product [Trichogramma brassicae]|uniref:Uncharacterized protein n=1 Tax=Trichogramma brassicae TaxID=86971 RepID=A0A6H5HWK1_9HYME|nr:unnamed protein product [Trichogramma brassicae]
MHRRVADGAYIIIYTRGVAYNIILTMTDCYRYIAAAVAQERGYLQQRRRRCRDTRCTQGIPLFYHYYTTCLATTLKQQLLLLLLPARQIEFSVKSISPYPPAAAAALLGRDRKREGNVHTHTYIYEHDAGARVRAHEAFDFYPYTPKALIYLFSAVHTCILGNRRCGQGSRFLLASSSSKHTDF